MPSDSYPYAVGRIRRLELSLLEQADFNRISEQPPETAVKSLADTGYGQNAQNKDDADALVTAEFELLRTVINELTPKKELTDLFFLTQDAINIKLLLKARLLGDTIENDEFAFGLFNVEILKKAVNEKKYSDLPGLLAEGMLELEKIILEKGQLEDADPFMIGAMVDRIVYKFIFNQIKSSKNALVSRYFKAKVDFTNILSMLRVRLLKWKKERFSLVFIDGGEVSAKTLLGMYDLADDAIVNAAEGEYKDVIRRGINACFTETGSIQIHAAAMIFDDALLDIAAAERHDSFGIGPVVYYLLRKIDEGRRIRVLFTHIRSGEPAKKDSRRS